MINFPFINLNKSLVIESELGKVGMQGFFKLVVTRGNGAVETIDWFPNLILNAGLDRLAAGSAVSGVAVGTNSTPPAVTDTQLLSLVKWTTLPEVKPEAPLPSLPVDSRRAIAFSTSGGTPNCWPALLNAPSYLK